MIRTEYFWVYKFEYLARQGAGTWLATSEVVARLLHPVLSGNKNSKKISAIGGFFPGSPKTW